MLFILIFITSLLLQFFLPWWILVPIAFCLSFWKARTSLHALGSGFVAIFSLWIGMGLVRSIPNENLLANRVGEMLTLPPGSFNWIIVLLITGFTGALAAGISALAGYYSKDAIKSRKRISTI